MKNDNYIRVLSLVLVSLNILFVAKAVYFLKIYFCVLTLPLMFSQLKETEPRRLSDYKWFNIKTVKSTVKTRAGAFHLIFKKSHAHHFYFLDIKFYK